MDSEQLPIKEKLKASDPRDYIAKEKFLKTAGRLDPSPESPWKDVRNTGFGRLLSENDDAVVATGIAKKGSDYKLITFSRYGETAYSKTLEGLTQAKAECIAETIKQAAIHLPNEQRCAFVRMIGKRESDFQELDLTRVTEVCYTELLSLVPDLDKEKKVKIDFPDNQGEEPTKEQRIQLKKYLKIVSRKLNQEQTDKLIEKFKDDCHWRSGVFSVNYNLSFPDIFNLMLAERDDLLEDFESLTPKRPAQRFPVEGLTSNNIASEEQLEKILKDMPAKKPPEARLMFIAERGAEFVDLDKVVGGHYEISHEDGTFLLQEGTRGLPHIFKMCQDLQTGTMDINHSGPIRVQEYEGEYFVVDDGRHRIAALKALGVPFVPMIVSRLDLRKTA